MKYPAVQYHDYLCLDQILSAQKPKSVEYNQPAHDENLFITVHQTYELWFKQILIEIESVMKLLAQNPLPEKEMGLINHRMERVCAIFKLILGQIDVLETMTPMEFLNFRDMLFPASGFQSFQFRALETALGLRVQDRMTYGQQTFTQLLTPTQQKIIQSMIEQKSLFELLESWLERNPFLADEHLAFWKSYQETVEKIFAEDRVVIQNNSRLTDLEKKRNLDILSQSLQTFHGLFSEESFQKLQEQKYFRLSWRAVQSALLIQMYRDEPILQGPYRFLNLLSDLDELMTQWRYRHAQMAYRMLGKKIGTGGSSGSDYLKLAADNHKIFTDLFNLSTFLIPMKLAPPLPEIVAQRMSFVP